MQIPRAYIAASGSIFLWGTLASIGVRLTHIPTFLLVGIAFLCGGTVGLFLSKWDKVSFSKVLLAVYGILGFHFCIFTAFRLSPPVEANLISYLWPLMIVLLAPLFLKGVRLRILHITGGMIGFAGAVIAISGGSVAFDLAFLKGYGFAMGSAVAWSTFTLLSKRLQPFETGNITIACFVSGLFSLGYHFLFEETVLPQVVNIISIVYLGIGPMGLAFYLWNYGLKAGDPRVMGALAYFTPLLSTLLLGLTGGGELTMFTFVAVLLIICGAVIGAWQQRAPIT